MIKPKLYLYDSSATDYKGTDYSNYILSGIQYTDDLTEVLDTCELTLVGLSTSEEFAPTTKFILEIYDTDLMTDEDALPEITYHLCVASDVVSQPILSDSEYFNHSISFNEPSVIAQGRIVDDISETYKLKNVSLTTTPTYSTDATVSAQKTNVTPKSAYNNGTTITGSAALWWFNRYFKFRRKFSFKFGGEYGLSGTEDDWTILQNQVISNTTTLSLPIPLIVTQVGADASTVYDSHENFCSTITKVYIRTRGTQDEWELDTTVGNNGVIETNPSTSNSYENDWEVDWHLAQFDDSAKGYGTNRAVFRTQASGDYALITYYKKLATFDSLVRNRTLNITLQTNKEYKIVCMLNDQSTGEYDLGTSDYFVGDSSNLACYDSLCGYEVRTPVYSKITDEEASFVADSGTAYNNAPTLTLTFNTYAEGATTEVAFTSAPALSAYDLFLDAQLKSQELWRGDTNIKDPDNLPYYCNDDDVYKLQNAEIIESSFHQKNFWEVLLEIGKYIHAIPYITFGNNDRYLVNWKLLGQPDQYKDNSTTVTIYNSRSIENYVGAVNSYVNNMVQLGALVSEWVSPKSESEDYLVYNDVAVLKTSKPIIEIYANSNEEGGVVVKYINSNSKITSISVGDTADITKYVFENSIYQLLGVEASVEPNKGLSIYYNLGENVIRGLNYQLPSTNTGDNETEYAIKRIIGTAFGISSTEWKDIRVNDFAFNITYRTKENVRSEQSRPDLRKYLINSAYETIPQHKQFNNQQDVSVDSVKFGNQTYGKLIKLGNTEIETTEWSSDLYKIKNSGELIEIRGNLYYVSKATHVFYQDHIDSKIVYSKDYNLLSDIIGIPSEPRFYEISERNVIDRQVNANAYLLLGTEQTATESKYVTPTGMEYIRNLLFTSGVNYPKYALTNIKNDKTNSVQFHKDLIHPISGYSMRNTLSFKWAMEDNFSAGDSIIDTTYSTTPPSSSNPANTSYTSLTPTQYVDIYGRGDLYDFVIADLRGSSSLSSDQIKAQPNCPLRLHNGGRLTTFLGYAVYESTLGITYDTINLSTNLTLPIGPNGSLRDSNNNDIASYSNSVGSYVIVKDGDYSAVYYLAYKTEVLGVRRAWYVRYNYGVNQDLTELETNYFDRMFRPYFGSEVFSGGSLNKDFGDNAHGLALIKDNREHLMFNFNLQMLTDSDRFVLSGYMWRQEKESTIKLATLSSEVNKICNNTLPSSRIINTYTLSTTYNYNAIYVPVSTILNGEDVSAVKSIAVVSTAKPSIGTGTENYFVIARNVSDLEDSEKIADWVITAPNSDFFNKQ